MENRVAYMQAFAQEMRDIAFHIEHTDVGAYGNKGCEHGRYKLLDDCGATRDHDSQTLVKVANLFESFFGKSAENTTA